LVFHEELGAQVAGRAGFDQDRFDSLCDHLLVRDAHTGKVVGTYRLLSYPAAQRAGGFYSESEFDLRPLRRELRQALELGRACVHRDYRNGAVIAALWSGIMDYVARHGARYLIGCASIDLTIGLDTAAGIVRGLQVHAAPQAWRVEPRNPFRSLPAATQPAKTLPALLKGYVRAGAVVCSEPAWDPKFGTLDLFMLLPVAAMRRRYVRRFAPTHRLMLRADVLGGTLARLASLGRRVIQLRGARD
jgi:putative hemolysin